MNAALAAEGQRSSLNPGKAYPNEAEFNSYIERQSEKQMNVIGHEYESVQEIMPFASILVKNLQK